MGRDAVIPGTAVVATAQALVARGKGLLAMDESIGTCNKRFAAKNIPQTEAARRAWRELLITAPGLGASISGAILFDETIRQSDRHGTLHAGERIRWTRNEGSSPRLSRNRDPARRLANGEFGTVSQIAGHQVELIMDNGRTFTIDPNKRSDQHFDYGYAVTSYAAQGRTETQAIFHAESYRINLINAASFYVALSRHKEAAVVVTDDRQDLINAINDRAGMNSTALEIRTISDAAERTVKNEADLLHKAPAMNPAPAEAGSKNHNPRKVSGIERDHQRDLQL